MARFMGLFCLVIYGFAQFDGRAEAGFHMRRLLLYNYVTTICNPVHNTFVTLVLAFDPPMHYDKNIMLIASLVYHTSTWIPTRF